MRAYIYEWFSKTNEEMNEWLWNWTIGWAIIAILITMLASPCHSQTFTGRNPFYQEPNYSPSSAPPAAWPQYTSGSGYFGWFLSIFKAS